MSNENKLGFFLLNSINNVMDVIDDGNRRVNGCFLISSLNQTSLTSFWGFRNVLVNKFQNFFGQVGFQRITEHINNGRNLQTVLKKSFLTLDTDISRPFNETCKVSGWCSSSCSSFSLSLHWSKRKDMKRFLFFF